MLEGSNTKHPHEQKHEKTTAMYDGCPLRRRPTLPPAPRPGQVFLCTCGKREVISESLSSSSAAAAISFDSSFPRNLASAHARIVANNPPPPPLLIIRTRLVRCCRACGRVTLRLGCPGNDRGRGAQTTAAAADQLHLTAKNRTTNAPPTAVALIFLHRSLVVFSFSLLS